MPRVGSFRPPQHGGALDRIAEAYGVPAASILDFSANVNPDGLPEEIRERLAARLREPGFLERYPDGEYGELADRLATQLGVDRSHIVLSNGAAALIRQSVTAVRASSAVLPVPAFSEYASALRAADTEPTTLVLRPEDGFRIPLEVLRDVLRGLRPGLCLLSNPHNPSGAIATCDETRALLATTRELGVTLIVDEAFIDYAPEQSVTREVDGPGLIAIRSLTKFYGMPGMRIGFAVVSEDVADSVRAQIPSWPAGRLDVAAALAAIELLDAEAARRENAQRREILESGLRIAGLETYPSAANFLLARLADEMPPVNVLSERLIREHRIFVRDCSSYDGLEEGRFLRVAVRRPEDNEKLVSALGRVL